MPHKYAELVKPLEIATHSPSHMVESNPGYTKLTEDTNQVYSVSSPLGVLIDMEEPGLEKSL